MHDFPSIFFWHSFFFLKWWKRFSVNITSIITFNRLTSTILSSFFLYYYLYFYFSSFLSFFLCCFWLYNIVTVIEILGSFVLITRHHELNHLLVRERMSNNKREIIKKILLCVALFVQWHMNDCNLFRIKCSFVSCHLSIFLFISVQGTKDEEHDLSLKNFGAFFIHLLMTKKSFSG